MKFAHFYDGRSHQFDAAEMEDGYFKTNKVAEELMKNRKLEEAFTELVEFADGKVSDFQKAVALEQAAAYAMAGKRFDLAGEVIDWIPIKAVEKTVRMRYLLANSQALELVKQFAAEDITKWPFWKRGDGLHHRGRAYSIAKNGEKAEADLSAALDFIGDLRTRETVLLVLAQNRETNLKDDPKALEAYEAILAGKTRLGGADEYSALQGIARIQTRRGQFDEALKTLNRAEPEKLQGIWKTHFTKSIDEVKKAQGR